MSFADAETEEIIMHFVEHTPNEHTCGDCTDDLYQEIRQLVKKFYEA